MDDNTTDSTSSPTCHAEDYYYDAVLWAAQKGITGGMSDTPVRSERCPAPRAQIVTFLWRAAGSPEPKAAEQLRGCSGRRILRQGGCVGG